jgi:TldD protein
MSHSFTLAETLLLAPSGLAASDLERAFGVLLGPGVDFGDLYFQHARRESWSMEDGIVKDGTHAIEQGVGVRAVSGEKTGFAYSDEINLEALLEASRSARSIARDGLSTRMRPLQRGLIRGLYGTDDPIDGMAVEQKLAALRTVDTLLRGLDPRVKQVMVGLSGGIDTMLVARSDGLLAADVRPLVRFNVSVIVEQGGRRETGYSGGGGRYSYAELLGEGRPERWAREALRQALVNLDAGPAPAGPMTVVLGPGWPGVLLHEAVGHGLEGDFNRKGTSTYAGRIGEQVAASGVTIVDDGTLAQRRGSLNVDDEGNPSRCNVLIEDGVLRGYMHDALSARLAGVSPTGNGRRESFAHMPMPRMTNTYMLPGAHDPGEILRSVKRGLYAANFAGGQVDITSGRFVFSTSEAYLIEDGHITRPVKGATLIGNGPEVMRRVRMVGSDLKLDDGVGVCGKDGQSVPVGVGQPTLLVDDLTVGGTEA